MRDRDEFRKEMDNPLINRLSKAAHADDVRRNAEPKAFFPKKKTDDQHPTSRAFQQKWGI